MASTASATRHTNRLIHETSPYLLQHAHNPVDWHAWGPEAFQIAREQNRPIFLSVGYSTCYWCHVMERQCFENEGIAREMNARFVNIKVDREERPDVDQLYMNAVQVLTRSGGWPMSVFLTPDLRPFYAGTYFPPGDAHGRPGFPTILRAIDDAYHKRPEDVEQTASQLIDILHQLAEPQAPEAAIIINWESIAELVDRSTADYDAEHGGFGSAPKFPRQTALEMLFAFIEHVPSDGDAESNIEKRKAAIVSMLTHSLDAMADGGIHDHLGGGFHRYATDARWLVPHFEIMLYDNAMLAWLYAHAFVVTEDQRYARVARGVLDFVLREMTSDEGAFYTAFDAEVDAMEGASYLWTREEIESVLGAEDARLFNSVYGVDRGPNFADPHHGAGVADKSILYLPEPMEMAAERLKMSDGELESRLAPMRRKLYDVRRQRKQPLLDTKVITAWNALMIRALAYAGRVLDESRYVEAAARAADFLLARHAMPGGGLWHSSRDGVARHPAFLDDYALFAQALLELGRSIGQEHRRRQAGDIVSRMDERFGDPRHGGYYFTAAEASDIIVRQKIGSDSPLPSGNAVAAMAKLDLDFPQVVRETIAVFAGQVDSIGEGMSAMLQAAILYLGSHDTIAVSPSVWRAAPEQGEAEAPMTPHQLAAAVVSMETEWEAPDQLLVRVKVAGGFHINAHEAAPSLVATQLHVRSDGDVASIDYPPGEEERFAYAEQGVRVYEGTVTIAVRFRRPPPAGSPIRLALTCQPCNDDTCLPPMTKQVAVHAR